MILRKRKVRVKSDFTRITRVVVSVLDFKWYASIMIYVRIIVQ